ncbi:MAG: TlpA disulfide reductase family protein [Bacteroidota bacterium]
MKKHLLLSLTLLSLFLTTSSFRLGHPEGEVVIVEDHLQINSFDELTAKFKGKVLYIDIWATWCGPCRRQMQYKDQLLDFVKDKDIELLYISADKLAAEATWSDFIKQNNLTGNHVLANDELISDLRNRFYSGVRKGRKVLSLPTYIIVGKNGRILNSDAKRPSHEGRLYRQLNKALKRK